MPKSIITLHSIFATILLFSIFTLNAQKKIFYIHDRDTKIQRANLNGSNLENIVVSRLDGPIDIEVDSENGHIYWSETGKVLRYDSNNDRIQIIREYQAEGAFTTNITAISLDLVNNKIYWINGGDRRMEKSNLDGSEFEIVISGSEMSNSLSMAVDPENQKIYWSTLGGSIRSMGYDGNGIEDIVTEDIYQPSGLILDNENNKLYWTDLVGNEVKRSNLDGSGVEEVISTDLENPEDLVFNEDMSKLYILDKGGFGDDGILLEANVDGSEMIEIINDLGDPTALAFDKLNNRIMWLDESSPATMVEMTVDGLDRDTLLTEVSVFEKLRISGPHRKIFWISSGDIFSADLDGRNTEMLIETNTTAQDITVDPVDGEIYWSELSSIRKAKLDGTEIQDLITSGVDEPDYLSFDRNAGKIYWIDGGFDSDKIKWANLDGSDVQDLATGLDQALDLKLNQNTAKIYWREGGSFPTILKRANKDGTDLEAIADDGSGIHSYYVSENQDILFWSSRDIIVAAADGSEQETIIDESELLYGLAADPGEEKIYWYLGDRDENIIWRANYDGSDAHAIIQGLPSSSNRELVLYGDGITGTLDSRVIKDDYKLTVYPNPVNGVSLIKFKIPDRNHVIISLYDITGKQIKLLFDNQIEKGIHSITFRKNDIDSGLYFLRMYTEDSGRVERVIVLD